MPAKSFNELFKLTKVADLATAATSDVTSSTIDMAGYTGVIFFSSYGTPAANNLPHAETSSNDSDWNDLEGTEVNVSTSDEDVWLEINLPQERYLRTVWERGTSSTLGDVWAIQYGARVMAQDNTTAGTIHGEAHVSPDEGTI